MTTREKTAQELDAFSTNAEGEAALELQLDDGIIAPYWRLLRRNRNYTMMWCSEAISFFGDWLNYIASLGLLTSLTDSSVVLSLFICSRFLPPLITIPISGYVLDTLPVKWVMVAMDICRVVIALGYILAEKTLLLWLLFASSLAQFFCSSFFDPARYTLIPLIVDKRDIVRVSVLDSLTWSVMFTAGSAAGGLLAHWAGSTVCYTVDSATFLISASLLLLVQVPKQDMNDNNNSSVAVNNSEIESLLAEEQEQKAEEPKLTLGQNFLLLLRGKFTFLLTFAKCTSSIVWGCMNYVVIQTTEEIHPYLGSGSVELGVLWALRGIGTAILPPILEKVFRATTVKHNMWCLVLLGYALACIGTMVQAGGVLGWYFLNTSIPFFLFYVGQFLRGGGDGNIWVYSAAVLQRTANKRIRGTIFSFENTVYTLGEVASTLLAGIAIEYFLEDALGGRIQCINVLTITASVISVINTVFWGLVAAFSSPVETL